MATKKTISSLIETLEGNLRLLEGLDDSLEKSLKLYEKSIGISQELLGLLDRHKETYTTLKRKADGLFDA